MPSLASCKQAWDHGVGRRYGAVSSTTSFQSWARSLSRHLLSLSRKREVGTVLLVLSPFLGMRRVHFAKSKSLTAPHIEPELAWRSSLASNSPTRGRQDLGMCETVGAGVLMRLLSKVLTQVSSAWRYSWGKYLCLAASRLIRSTTEAQGSR